METGIVKTPLDSIEVRAPGPKGTGLGSGVVGDEVVDGRHHGGDWQAVYAFAREELDHWAGVLGAELPDGAFGENLTTEGVDVDGAVIGEVWRVGTAALRVTGPRIPCRTFATRLGVRGWVRTFSERGRTGAYLAVVEPGAIRAGDPVEVLDRPAHGITVPDSFRALMGDDEQARRVLAEPDVFDPRERASLADRLWS
ncbi:MOSC domain-containing protein [Actinomycetota bacterium]